VISAAWSDWTTRGSTRIYSLYHVDPLKANQAREKAGPFSRSWSLDGRGSPNQEGTQISLADALLGTCRQLHGPQDKVVNPDFHVRCQNLGRYGTDRDRCERSWRPLSLSTALTGLPTQPLNSQREREPTPSYRRTPKTSTASALFAGLV